MNNDEAVKITSTRHRYPGGHVEVEIHYKNHRLWGGDYWGPDGVTIHLDGNTLHLDHREGGALKKLLLDVVAPEYRKLYAAEKRATEIRDERQAKKEAESKAMHDRTKRATASK